MKKWVLLCTVVALFLSYFSTPIAGALSLKMQPLIYKDTLKKGEKKKGFIDVSNPTPTKMRLKTSVQAFRQTTDQGQLQFYDDPQMSTGIKPDLGEFELGPREAVRMYFLIDGAKLPSGDVFAALFVSTVSEPFAGTNSSLRLGTLFTIVNGTPGSREAQITSLEVPFWQFGAGVSGKYTVKNSAREGMATGFYPSVTVAVDPFRAQKQIESSLVFAGRSRQNTFDLNTARIGLYKVSARYGDSTQKRYVFMVTGYWRLVIAAMAVLLVASIVFLYHLRVRKRTRHQRS